MKKKIFTVFGLAIAMLSNAQSSSFGMKWDHNRLSSGLTFQYQHFLNQNWEVRAGIRVQNVLGRPIETYPNAISTSRLIPTRDIDNFGLDLGVRRYFKLNSVPSIRPYLDFGVTTFTNSLYDSRLISTSINGSSAYLSSGNGNYQPFRVMDFKLITGFTYSISKKVSLNYGIGYSVQSLRSMSTDPTFNLPKRNYQSSMTLNAGLSFKLK